MFLIFFVLNQSLMMMMMIMTIILINQPYIIITSLTEPFFCIFISHLMIDWLIDCDMVLLIFCLSLYFFPVLQKKIIMLSFLAVKIVEKKEDILFQIFATTKKIDWRLYLPNTQTFTCLLINNNKIRKKKNTILTLYWKVFLVVVVEEAMCNYYI